jgi:hypothetical protein
VLSDLAAAFATAAAARRVAKYFMLVDGRARGLISASRSGVEMSCRSVLCCTALPADAGKENFEISAQDATQEARPAAEVPALLI